MATFLMISPYEHGMTRSHLMGLLDLGQRLMARGHRVLVYTEASARPLVEASGAEMLPHERYRELGARMHAAVEALPPWFRRSRLLRLPQMLYMGWHFRRAVLESAVDFAGELEPLLLRERVDCVVHDFLVYGAGYAAERLGIPSLTFGNAGTVLDTHGLPLQLRKSPFGRLLCRMPGLVHRVMDVLFPLGRVREALGLSRREQRHAEFFQTMASPRLHIVSVHPGFLKGIALRDNQLLSGPCTVEPRGREETGPPPPLASGTLLVSTTTVGGDGGLLRRVLEAVAPLGMPVLATANDRTELPPNLGSHIHVERFVSHEQVVPQVAAIVTHGGAGLVGRALRHGVPMLMIPLFAEQPLNAQLAEAQGLAYHLPLSRATPEAIRERLRALLEDRAMRERLQRVSAEINELLSRAVDMEALERMARETSERRKAA
ncbi:glycosyltransferase [Archangium violaceum]|uniref:glycosyltransferase n=1 Tax=Archangium violaceum TaxID=83451 RepID=UPI0036DBFB4B